MVLSEQQVPLKQYIKEKLRMLQKDFCIPLTAEQIAHMKSLKTDTQVDNYAYDLINQ